MRHEVPYMKDNASEKEGCSMPPVEQNLNRSGCGNRRYWKFEGHLLQGPNPNIAGNL